MARTKRLRLNMNRAGDVRRKLRLEAKGWRVTAETQWGLYYIYVFVKD